jgi:hypothetical protein
MFRFSALCTTGFARGCNTPDLDKRARASLFPPILSLSLLLLIVCRHLFEFENIIMPCSCCRDLTVAHKLPFESICVTITVVRNHSTKQFPTLPSSAHFYCSNTGGGLVERWEEGRKRERKEIRNRDCTHRDPCKPRQRQRQTA